MLAFNWFFLPPVHTFTLATSRRTGSRSPSTSATAVVVSELAARARRRAARRRAARARVGAARRDRDAAAARPRRSRRSSARSASSAARGARRRPRPRSSSGAPRGRRQRDAPIPLEVDGRAVGTIYTPRAPTRTSPFGSGSCRRSRRCSPSPSTAAGSSSEALEAETLRRSDLVKTALLRAVSHDLRSPLTGITHGDRRAPQRRRSSSATTTARELLDTIAVDAERLGRLVGDLLDLSRLEAGGAEPRAEVWALDELVREAVDDLGARDRVDVAGEAPLVDVDAVQIQRVLANLVENALEVLARRTPSARSDHRDAPGGDRARSSTRGPGWTEDELERVFEPFYRSGGDQRSGAGLGLAIARGFAAANGGRVWAESRPGQGATFALALPVVEVPAELPA